MTRVRRQIVRRRGFDADRIPRAAARALTLFEVLISVALIGMLSAALVSFFSYTVSIRDQAARQADRSQIIHQVLDRIASELQNAIVVDEMGFPVQHFAGTRRRLTFATTPVPDSTSYTMVQYADAALARDNLIEVTYELWVDPEDETEDGQPLVGGLLRTVRRALLPYNAEGRVEEEVDRVFAHRDLWSHELGYVEFRYFDGVDWTTEWAVDQGNPLPHLVQITIGFDSITKDEWEDQDLETYPITEYPLGPDQPNINRFSRIVRLRAADQTFSSRMQRVGSQLEGMFQTPGGMPSESGSPEESGTPGTTGQPGSPQRGQPVNPQEALEQLRRMAEQGGAK